VRALALALALLVVVATPASALAAACPRASVPDLEDEVMCLQCGVPLSVAEDAPSAKRERAFIQGLVDQCRSKGQIKTALVAQFGDKVLADPKSKATWLVPALGFAAAVLAVAFGAFRWRRRERTGPSPAPADDSRLQADMDRYDL
jgi:cytochrome c-type biogenesis protein CcmH/NrfF